MMKQKIFNYTLKPFISSIVILTLIMATMVTVFAKEGDTASPTKAEQNEKEQLLLEKVQELDKRMAKAPLEQRLKARDALLKKYNINLVSREYTTENDNDVSTQEIDKNTLTVVINAYQDEDNSRAYYIYGDWEWYSPSALPGASNLGAPDDAVALRMRKPENGNLQIDGRAMWSFDNLGNNTSSRVYKQFEDSNGVIWGLEDYSTTFKNYTQKGTAYMHIVAKVGTGIFQAKTYLDYEHNYGGSTTWTANFGMGPLYVNYSSTPTTHWQKNAASKELYFY